VAESRVPAELPRGRGADAYAWCCGQPRTIRKWCAKFEQAYANRLRLRQARPGDKWHLDEVFIRINGTIHYLWRTVDQHGTVLDILVPPRRNVVAAKKFFRKLLNGLRYVPRPQTG
jgi:putative transposase